MPVWARVITNDIKQLIQLSVVIKVNHTECFKEKDLTELYRTFRVFYENRMEQLKSIKLSASEESKLLALSKECKKSCSCQTLLDFADSNTLSKKIKKQILKNASLASSEISSADYKNCFKQMVINCTNSSIIREFNEFKAD